jgi:hypothetical protein
MKKIVIFCILVCGIFNIFTCSPIFATEKMETAGYVYSIEQIVSFSAFAYTEDSATATAKLDHEVNNFLTKNPNIVITDRKMSTAAIPGRYIITVTIFYRVSG